MMSQPFAEGTKTLRMVTEALCVSSQRRASTSSHTDLRASRLAKIMASLISPQSALETLL